MKLLKYPIVHQESARYDSHTLYVCTHISVVDCRLANVKGEFMKSLAVMFALLLSGCSVAFVPTYHETEFNELVTIAAQSTRGTCDVEQTTKLLDLSTHLLYYTELSPNNTQLHSGAVELDASVRELFDHTQPMSPIFCSLKLRLINKMALTLGAASGGKPQ